MTHHKPPHDIEQTWGMRVRRVMVADSMSDEETTATHGKRLGRRTSVRTVGEPW